MKDTKKVIEIANKQLQIISMVLSIISVVWSFLVLLDRLEDNSGIYPEGLLDWFALIGFLLFFSMFLALVSIMIKVYWWDKRNNQDPGT